MTALEELDRRVSPHIPVLINDILKIAAPVKGRWLDGTLGAGGYTKALLEAGAEYVTGIDRDPSVFAPLQGLANTFEGRLHFVKTSFPILPPTKVVSMELFWILACLQCSSIKRRAGFLLCVMGRWTCGCQRPGNRQRIW